MHSGCCRPPAIYWEELYFSFTQWWGLLLLAFITYTVNSDQCESPKVPPFFLLLWKECELHHPAKTTFEWNFTILLNVCWTVSCHPSECPTLLPSVFIAQYDAVWSALFLWSVGINCGRCISCQLLDHSQSLLSKFQEAYKSLMLLKHGSAIVKTALSSSMLFLA